MNEKPSFFSELKGRNVYNIAGPALPEEGIAVECFRYCSLCNFVLSRGMTTITCKIPDKISAHLEATARQRRVPKSQIVAGSAGRDFPQE